MFSTRDEALTALAEVFSDADLELATSALMRTVAFREAPPRLGGSRLGGCPDLPGGARWPIRPALTNLADVKARGGSAHAEHITTYGGTDVPFPFMAQIDCAEARRLAPEAASDLPSSGRLLFFYDLWCGPWGDDDVSTHVIHDATPPEKLVPCAPPEALLAIERRERAAWKSAMEDAKLDIDDADAPRAVDPPRAIEPHETWVLPDLASFDARRRSDLVRRADDDDDFSDAYGQFAAWDGGLFEGPGGGMRLHRLLGPPVCIQRDPRIHGVLQDDATRYTDPGWSDPGWRARLVTKGLDWRVLLQVDLADLKQQRYVEGIVYFIIANDDLARRDFSRVRAVYQQT